MSPYREPEKKIATKKLPRIRARLHGYFRRIILPTFIASVAAFLIGAAWFNHIHLTEDRLELKELEQTRHFDEWSKAIDERQAAFDVKQAALDARRVAFEDNLAAYRMAFRKENQ